MTVKQLRDALAQLGAGHDNTKVRVWLPGTHIELNTNLTLGHQHIYIEGNVVAGEIK